MAADGTIYVGSNDGKLYAFDTKSTGNSVQPKWQLALDAFIYSSPAIGPDGTIYVGGINSALHAVSPTGQELWSHSVGGAVDSSPAVAPDGTIYFGSWDKRIYAINPDNSEKWSVLTGDIVVSSPAIGTDGTIYVGSEDGLLYAITPDGVTKWTFRARGKIDASPVLGPDGTIYVGSSDFTFYAINPDGSRKWTVDTGGWIYAAAAVRGDGIVLVASYDGIVRALRQEDGFEKWRFTPDRTTSFEASPVLSPDGTTIYAALTDGRLYAINGNGSPLSTFSSWPMFHRDAVHSGTKPALPNGGQLINLSTRGQVTGDANLIAGLVVAGSAQKNFLLRGVGPALAESPFNLSGTLSDPILGLYSGQVRINRNNDWGDSDGAQIQTVSSSVGAFALPQGSKDAALVASLQPGIYTAVIDSADGTSGVSLVEAYDAAVSNPGARLINVSTRGLVGNGAGVLIAGLVVGGSGSVRVLLRAGGPALTDFGLSNVLAQPTINAFTQSGALLGSNTGWTSTGLKADLAAAALATGAFPFKDNSADCATLLTLASGNYTLQVAGVGGSTGVALVEVYLLP